MKKKAVLLLAAAAALTLSGTAMAGETTTSYGTYTDDAPYHLVFEYIEP